MGGVSPSFSSNARCTSSKQMWLKQTDPAWGDHVSHAGREILKPVKISIVGGLIGEPGKQKPMDNT